MKPLKHFSNMRIFIKNPFNISPRIKDEFNNLVPEEENLQWNTDRISARIQYLFWWKHWNEVNN